MSSQVLRRYTSLDSALHMLQTKTVTLLPPDTWDDKVDRNLIAAYARKAEVGSVLALCMSRASETYHHWRIFTEGKSGVCVVFDKEKLVVAAKAQGVRAQAVIYTKIADNRASPVTTARLPFTKRYAFRDEKEFRLVYDSESKEIKAKSVPVPVAAFGEIVLNPWMHDSLAEAVKRSLVATPCFSKLTIRKSKLFDSPYWKSVTDA